MSYEPSRMKNVSVTFVPVYSASANDRFDLLY